MMRQPISIFGKNQIPLFPLRRRIDSVVYARYLEEESANVALLQRTYLLETETIILPQPVVSIAVNLMDDVCTVRFDFLSVC